MIQFFTSMIPPTATHQQKRGKAEKGKLVFYEPPNLKDARAKLMAHLARYAPPEPMEGALRLLVKWCFPLAGHPDGSYKVSRPDTDNLQKLLKDVMTDLGYWRDDAQVASEIVEKFHAAQTGLFIRIEVLP